MSCQEDNVSSTTELLSQYDSDNSNETLEDAEELEIQSPKKIRGKSKVYEKYQTYESIEYAKTDLKSIDNGWNFKQATETIEGEKLNYQCSYYKKGCSKVLYILKHADRPEVTIFISIDEHDHQDSIVRGIPFETKEEIQKIFSDGVTKPKAILKALSNRNVPLPDLVQLKNYLIHHKKTIYGEYSVSLGQIEEWCKTRLDIPNEMDQVFVGKYEILVDEDIENEITFRIFFTTKRLLINANSNNNLIATDATYKLIWHGYPVLIVGTTDKRKVFHPFGLAVCANEKEEDFSFIFKSLNECTKKVFDIDYKPTILLADASRAITNGFTATYSAPTKRIMCWFHMKKKVLEHLAPIKEAKHKAELQKDIDTLQSSRTESIFNKAVCLFKDKWKGKSPQIDLFLEYFMQQWIVEYPGWYEGYAQGYPSTNNGLESTNRQIKEASTFRNRLPVGQFLALIEQTIVKDWSIHRGLPSDNPLQVPFSNEPEYTLQDFTLAHHWLKMKKDVVVIKIENRSLYFTPSQELTQLSKETAEAYIDAHNRCNWKSWDEFKSKETSMWCIMVDKNNWKLGVCSCPYYMKNNSCKHVIGISTRLKLPGCEIPLLAKQIMPGQKRKRGAPSKAKKALLLQ